MLKLDDIIGQNTAVKTLKSSGRSGKPIGAYLFTGPEGVGKASTALAWATALFCDAAVDGNACGVCGPCRKIASGSMPDLYMVKPEIRDRKTKQEIDISHIRNLIGRLAYKPFEARLKVAIMDGADMMNKPASNAFLKTLEEPPGDTVIILTAVNLNALLPTIVSRCRTVRFGPVAYDEMVGYLVDKRGMKMDRARVVAAVSKGSPGMVDSDAIEENVETRSEAMGLLSHASQNPVANVYKVASKFDKAANKNKTDLLLDCLRELVRDMLAVKTGAKYDNLLNMDLAAELKAAAEKFSERNLGRAFDLINDMTLARRRNISPLLALSLLLLELKD